MRAFHLQTYDDNGRVWVHMLVMAENAEAAKKEAIRKNPYEERLWARAEVAYGSVDLVAERPHVYVDHDGTLQVVWVTTKPHVEKILEMPEVYA